jgi:hypothetical protein
MGTVSIVSGLDVADLGHLARTALTVARQTSPIVAEGRYKYS